MGAAGSRVVTEPGNGTLEIFPLDTAAATLVPLCTEIFRDHWAAIRFGILIQGSVLEIRAPAAPVTVAMLDGYLTVAFDAWHLHICIDDHRGLDRPVDPRIAHHRRTARAEFYRRLDPAARPISWGLRLFNGQGEQQLTVFLPNPLLDEDDQRPVSPDWTRLTLWDDLRRRYLGLDPDPRDRTAPRFVHDE